MRSNYESAYEDLLDKTGKPNMNLKRTISICIEIYKILNNVNPEFMKDLLKRCVTKRAQTEK